MLNITKRSSNYYFFNNVLITLAIVVEFMQLLFKFNMEAYGVASVIEQMKEIC